MKGNTLWGAALSSRLRRIRGMSYPVECRCGQIYDLTTVESLHRYADCDTFKTPCCNTVADTRPWKSLPDFHRIDKRTGEWR